MIKECHKEIKLKKKTSWLIATVLVSRSSPFRFPSSVSSLNPVKLAVVGSARPDPLGPRLLEPGRTMVRGATAKKLMKMVPRTNMTTRKMRKVALA